MSPGALVTLEAAARADDSPTLPVLVEVGEARCRAGDADAARAAFPRVAVAARSHDDGELSGRASLGFARPSWRNFGVVDEVW